MEKSWDERVFHARAWASWFLDRALVLPGQLLVKAGGQVPPVEPVELSTDSGPVLGHALRRALRGFGRHVLELLVVDSTSGVDAVKVAELANGSDREKVSVAAGRFRSGGARLSLFSFTGGDVDEDRRTLIPVVPVAVVAFVLVSKLIGLTVPTELGLQRVVGLAWLTLFFSTPLWVRVYNWTRSEYLLLVVRHDQHHGLSATWCWSRPLVVGEGAWALVAARPSLHRPPAILELLSKELEDVLVQSPHVVSDSAGKCRRPVEVYAALLLHALLVELRDQPAATDERLVVWIHDLALSLAATTPQIESDPERALPIVKHLLLDALPMVLDSVQSGQVPVNFPAVRLSDVGDARVPVELRDARPDFG